MSFQTTLKNKLKTSVEKHLFRQRFYRESPAQALVWVEGKPYLSFSSNDYLGLANHPEVIRAFQQGAAQYGVGSGASALLGGYTKAHRALEEALAEFFEYPRCLLFSTGFMANLGVIQSLAHSMQVIFLDKLAHASLIDAALSSKADCVRYQHNHIQDLKNKIEKNQHKMPFIITEGVFSMQGDEACLDALITLKKETHALLMVDDAHGIGVLGEKGQGVVEGKQQAVSLLVGTFGKAFGTAGAFVAGSDLYIETLIQYARPYIYTTALPPAVCEATRASLQLLKTEKWRRTHLKTLIDYFQSQARSLKLPVLPSHTPIQAIEIGDDAKTMDFFEKLKQQGFWVAAVRPPTVPPGRSLLRISLSVHHQIEHLTRLLTALSALV